MSETRDTLERAAQCLDRMVGNVGTELGAACARSADELRALAATLPETRRAAILAHLAESGSRRTTAEHFGISYERVRQIAARHLSPSPASAEVSP